jgi:hypothetical protein
MTAYQPQEQHGEPGRPERVEGERDVGAVGEAERLDEQPEESAHSPRVEDETDGAPVQERDLPEDAHSGEDERDGAAAQEAERSTATATALPGDVGAGPALMPDEQLTVLEDRDTAPSHAPARTPTSAHGDLQVFDPGELEGYRSRWESLQLGFVDDPKRAAEEADTVVGELLGRLTERRQALSVELNRQSEQDVDTESMRLAVRNYRSLFRRLVGS